MNAQVGIVGLGILGSAIAEVLLANRFRVAGYDIEDSKAQSLDARGLVRAASTRALVSGAEAILTCLPTAESLKAATSDDLGLISPDLAGKIVIEASTLPIPEKEAARARVESAGADMLDCPLSGNRIMALKGELTAFASGREETFKRVEPLLRGFCREAHFVGPFGDGMKMKICGNILNLVHNSVAAEVMVLGMKSGLDPKTIHKVIGGSGSSSRMFDLRGGLMAENDYMREGMNFSIPLKDARIISQQAADVLCPIPIYQAALQPYYAAVAQGHFDEDASAVCAALELAANCVREKKWK
ncbi:MAG: NAD(P)-dependent oxidoreductase [Alphaproteobacteria bacterium]|nr:NAD(P)-dependent oxidoreductase [Alphaproteobacteria bacterium]